MGRAINTKDIRPGDIWINESGMVRVMAVAEGYVIYRRRGCMACVQHHNQFRACWRFTGAPEAPLSTFPT